MKILKQVNTVRLVEFGEFFSIFLIFSILLICISILLLTLDKRYRRIPNLFLLASFVLFLIHNIFYLLEYQGFFVVNHYRTTAIMPFQLMPPLLIFLYVHTRLNGNITGIRELYRYFGVFILGVVFFIPIALDSVFIENSVFVKYYSHVYRVIFSMVTVAMYVYYSRRVISVCLIHYQIKDHGIFKNLNELPHKARALRFVVGLLFINGIWFLFEFLLSTLVGLIHRYFDFLICFTFLGLTIALSYVFITNPKIELVNKHG